MRVLLFIFSLSISLCAFSQAKKTPDVFEDAYLISLKGDTIRGQIRTSKFKNTEYYQKINFKDKTNKLRLYTPDKIAGYGYKNHYYVSAFHDNKPCYFKVLSKGKLTLLQIRFETRDEGVVQETEDLCVLSDGQEAEMKVLDAKSLKKQLKDIFKSNKTLAQKISEQKEIPYNTEVIEGYFNEYNQISRVQLKLN